MKRSFFLSMLLVYGQSFFGMVPAHRNSDDYDDYPEHVRPVSVAAALAMKKVTRLPVDPQDFSLEAAHVPQAVFSSSSDVSESRSDSASPAESLLLGLKDKSLRSILKKSTAKRGKKEDWAPTAKRVVFEAEQNYEDFSQRSSEYEVERSVAKPKSVGDDQSIVVAPVNSFKRSGRLTNCSYSDCLDGQILIASEESKEKKDAAPLERLSESFASLFYEMDSDDTYKSILNEAITKVTSQLQQLQQLFGEPACDVALISSHETCQPKSFNKPVFKTVPIQEPQPIAPEKQESPLDSDVLTIQESQPVVPAQKVIQVSLSGGDDFDRMFTEALKNHDKVVLEILKDSLDPETQEYRDVETALSVLRIKEQEECDWHV